MVPCHNQLMLMRQSSHKLGELGHFPVVSAAAEVSAVDEDVAVGNPEVLSQVVGVRGDY